MSEVPEPERTATPFVFGGAAFRRPSRQSALPWAAVALALLLPARGLFRYAGSLMEEGFMLVFPRLVRQGQVPNVDFLHLYGPGALHALAAWLWVFDESLASERVFGFGQIVVAVVAITVAARPWGWQAALPAAGTMTVLMITPTGFSALAWPGALAMSLVSLLFGVRALHLEGRPRRVATVSAGLLAGLALTFRPDMVLALGLGWGVLLWLRVKLTDALIGALIGAIPMWVHLAMAGIGPAWQGMFVEPVFELRPGRRLPVPPTWGELDGALQALSENPVESPWWGIPSLGASQQLFFWFVVLMFVSIGSVVFGIWRWRTAGANPRIVWYTVLALFGVGLIGQAVQRPDSTHLAWGSSVAFSLLGATVVEVHSMLRSRDRDIGSAVESRGWLVAPTATVLALLLFACPFFTFRPYLYLSRVSVGNLPSPGLPVRNGDLHFYLLNREVQSAAQQAVDLVDARAQPGERLLVGLADMRRTVYSDVIFYYLLPQLEPATQFIEFDPGIADAPGSSLAADVESADWLILTNFWTGWYEPNASTEEGSSAPNQAVADGFCIVGNYSNGLVMVFQKCAMGDGIDPATIGVGPVRRQSMLDEKARRGE